MLVLLVLLFAVCKTLGLHVTDESAVSLPLSPKHKKKKKEAQPSPQ